MRNKRDKAYMFGLWAEFIAAMWLRLRGYKVLSMRYKTAVGEIDIIARRGRTLVFIEVKGRRDLSTALESVTPQMKQRIARAAAHYISRYPQFAGLDMRFDVMVFAPPFYARHLDNAWQPPS